MNSHTFPRSVRAAAILAAAMAVAGTSAVVATTLTPAAAASAAPSAAAGGRGHVTVLRFGVIFSDHYLVDVPPANPGSVGLGDYALFSDKLLDRKGHVVGTEGGSGLVTDIKTGQIFFTLAIQLPHGQIAASGLSSAAPSISATSRRRRAWRWWREPRGRGCRRKSSHASAVPGFRSLRGWTV